MPKFVFPKLDAASWMLGIALLVSACVYVPGLSGGFVYDDSTFIVGNTAVHVSTIEPHRWAAAAFAFPGGAHQGRWLGMLTFAANYYVGGLDPYGYKLTNLAIHLLNGVLLFLALRALFAWRRECRAAIPAGPFDDGTAAAAIAALWLLLPINLTAVLYVSQRLEALSNTFVFLGLWLHLRARIAHWRTNESALPLWSSLVVCTGIGVLVKESAILLPLYAASIESVLGRARNADGKRSRTILTLYAVVLLAPTIAGLVWLASWVFGPASYAHSFDTIERLLTEARVLVGYIGWTFAPSLDALTLYHDDIAVSKSLFDPISTFACLVGLGALLIAAWWQRERRPLFSIGILWFFCAHLLTATIIPLLLAFEHRNYFASAGLLLAAIALVPPESPARRRFAVPWLAFAALGAFYAFTTWMRAEEWSDPIRLAVSEASKRPASPLAQYDKAATLIKAGPTAGSGAVEEGVRVLEEKRHLDGAGISYEQALIALATAAGKPVDPDWYASILTKLRAGPPSLQDARALQHLNECFARGACKAEAGFLDQAYAAAMSFPHPSALLFYVHSQYAAFLKDDYVQAEQDLRRAIAMSPFDGATREALATILLQSGKRAEANMLVEQTRRVNFLGALDGSIRNIEAQIAGSR